MTCLECASPSVSEAVDPPVDPGQAGASALREYQRRHEAREQHARETLGGLGVILAKVVDEPQSIRAWQQGSSGEVRAARHLEKRLDGRGVRLLHDRRVPAHGRANIDHIAVGPGGVTVIDTKTHRGKIKRDWSGGLFVGRRTILRINGRDQTKLITGVEKQVGYLRSALTKIPGAADVDVKGALCFPDIDGLPIFRSIDIRGVLVEGPKRIAQLAARPGSLTPDTVQHIWTQLARAFPSDSVEQPATFDAPRRAR